MLEMSNDEFITINNIESGVGGSTDTILRQMLQKWASVPSLSGRVVSYAYIFVVFQTGIAKFPYSHNDTSFYIKNSIATQADKGNWCLTGVGGSILPQPRHDRCYNFFLIPYTVLYCSLPGGCFQWKGQKDLCVLYNFLVLDTYCRSSCDITMFQNLKLPFLLRF